MYEMKKYRNKPKYSDWPFFWTKLILYISLVMIYNRPVIHEAVGWFSKKLIILFQNLDKYDDTLKMRAIVLNFTFGYLPSFLIIIFHHLNEEKLLSFYYMISMSFTYYVCSILNLYYGEKHPWLYYNEIETKFCSCSYSMPDSEINNATGGTMLLLVMVRYYYKKEKKIGKHHRKNKLRLYILLQILLEMYRWIL